MKKLLFLAALIASGYAGISFPAMGKAGAFRDSVEKIITEETARLMEQPGYGAVSGVLYIRGKVWQFHYGRLSNGKEPDSNTIYEIGSITKTYTGLLLSQAVHDRKIGLDEDVRRYLDGKYPNLVLAGGRPVTFRHLITHTSGLPLVMNCNEGYGTVAEQLACFGRFSREAFFKALQSVRLTDSSGENYHYSGVGTQLTGYILEQVYQMRHMELLQHYIFSRSGERQTFSELGQEANPNVSIGRNSEGAPMPLINGFYNYSGGMKSSVASMLSYIRMYLESSDAVVMQAMDRLAGDAQYGRAYTWNTYGYNSPRRMLYHNGSSFGHSSWIALYPDQKVGIFIVTPVVTDSSQGKLNELSNRIIDRLDLSGD